MPPLLRPTAAGISLGAGGAALHDGGQRADGAAGGLPCAAAGRGGGGVGKAAEGVRRAASLSSDLGCVLARSCGFQVASLSSPLPEYAAEMLGRWQVAEIRAQLPPGTAVVPR